MAGVLLIDIGNTRIKWLLASELNGNAPPHALDHGNDWDCGPPPCWSGLVKPTMVHVANVAGRRAAGAVRRWCDGLWGLEPVFAVSEARGHGVINGYADVAQMGVDRWLALIAAWRELGEACCVIDAGTAITLDVLDERGSHLGGWIAPGVGLMQAALDRGTSQVRLLTDDPYGVFGRDTAGCVEAGACAAVRGLVAEALFRVDQALGANVPFVVTGGAADKLKPALPSASLLRPALVLRGLALMAESRSP